MKIAPICRLTLAMSLSLSIVGCGPTPTEPVEKIVYVERDAPAEASGEDGASESTSSNSSSSDSNGSSGATSDKNTSNVSGNTVGDDQNTTTVNDSNVDKLQIGDNTTNNNVAGDQTNVSGDQVNNDNSTTVEGDNVEGDKITNITKINSPTILNINIKDDNIANGVEADWTAVEAASLYKLLLGGKVIAETSETSVSIPAESIPDGSNLSSFEIVATDGTNESEPLPQATSDISVVETTTVNGLIYNDSGSLLTGATISVKSLNSSVPYETSMASNNGEYTFYSAPSGVQLEIVVTKSGYTTRRRVEVLKSNKQADPDANRYDFGTSTAGVSSNFSAFYNALSDKPEVTKVSPGRNASGVNPGTSFVVTFSEPMNMASVEENFVVRNESGDDIWDDSAFDVDWNSDDTEVTFTFTNERELPTDKDPADVSDYSVFFTNDNSQLQDASGTVRSSDYFKLTDGDFEASYSFSIQTDEDKPELDSLVAFTGENGNSAGDEIKVQFSEPMVWYTLSDTIAGGTNGSSSQAAAAVSGSGGSVSASNSAQNYTVTVHNGVEVTASDTWGNLGGIAVFDTNDETHKRVLLRLNDSNNNLFLPGYGVTVEVATTVQDPAGNTVDAAANDASANAS